MAAAVWAASLFMLTGCASTSQVAPPQPPAPEHQGLTPQQGLAMQHFIDGSIDEQKGEYAQAALEYQEALRYDKNHAIYYALSRAYGMLNKPVPALEAGREAVDLAPDIREYRRNLAAIYLSAMKPDSAILQYENLVRLDSSNIESWFNLARLYQGRSPLKALEIYRRITERFGAQWDVLLQTADLCNKLGKFDEAADALKQMSEIDPGNKELQHTLAQTYARAQEFDSALAVYKSLRDAEPGNLQITSEMAGLNLLRKDYAAAAKDFDKILGMDSVTIEAKIHIGELYFDQAGKDSTLIPRTKNIFEKIKTEAPNDWRPYWFLGAIGSLTKDDSASVQNFRKVTELASWNADGWVYLSSVFFSSNNFDQMARVLESAIKVLPDDFRVNFFLGVAYSRLNRNIDAVRVLEHARSLNRTDQDAISQLALVYEALKHFGEADSLYEEALRLDPKNDLVLNNYSYSLAERNIQLDRALTMSKKAVAAKPENGSYLDTMGWIYFRLGEYTDAEKYVKKAIATGESSPVVYEHLGDIYYRMNNRDAAIEQWNLALQLDHNNSALRAKITRGSL
ncbi:MAG: tetratricopeptide repeat protein [Bacteroidota bacterium]